MRPGVGDTPQLGELPKVDHFEVPDFRAPPKRGWMGFPAVGLVLIGLRACLLIGRATEPSYTYDPIVLPQPYELPPLPTAPAAVATAPGPGPVAFAGTRPVYFQNSLLYTHAQDGSMKLLAVEGRQGDVLAVDARHAYWTSDPGSLGWSALRRVPLEGGITEDVEGISLERPRALLSDGKALFAVEQANLGGRIARVVPEAGELETLVDDDELVVGDRHAPIAMDATKLYFVRLADDGAESIAAVPKSAKSGDKPSHVATFDVGVDVVAVAADKDALWALGTTKVEGAERTVLFRVEKTGGAKKRVADLGPATTGGDLVVDGANLYVTRRDDSGAWILERRAKTALGSAAPMGRPQDEEPRVAAAGGKLLWTTSKGVNQLQ